MYRIFTATLLMLCTQSSFAQQTISGNVKDNTGPVATATVSLLNAADSSWIRSELTDDRGGFAFEKIAPGKYTLDVQAMGYANKKFEISLEDKPLYFLAVIEKQAGTLEQVTVTATKPFIESGPGKLIVNVGSASGAGSNAFDVLKKSPGVVIDESGNISLQGKQGITVLINERPTHLEGRQLVDYLKSLPAEDITKLELITQPSARFDAEGSAGIINIVQKKNKKEGFNGTVTITPGMGIYPTTHNNLNLTWKKNRLNMYMNGNYMSATGFLRGSYDRTITDEQDNVVTKVNGGVFMKERFSDALVRAGADYEINDKTTTGILISGNYHPNTQLDETTDVIEDVQNASTFYSHALHERGFLRKRMTGNAYLKHQIGEKQNVVTNADYTYSFRKSRQLLENRNYDEAWNEIPGSLFVRSWVPFTIEVYSLKSDYEAELSNNLKVEAGIKSSYAKTDNNAMFDILTNGAWTNDTGRTNHFIYQENINAAYASVNKDIDSTWKLQVGLRAEQANISGDQQVSSQYFERSSISVFPTVYVSYVINRKNELQLNYGRRIQRPQYRHLNPFPQYVSQYYYEVGNPMLKPQMTHNVELSHVYNSMLTTRVYCSRATDVLNGVEYKDSRPNVTYRRGENIAEENSIGMSASMYKKLLSVWELNVMAFGYYSDYYDTGRKAHRFGNGYGVNVDSQFNFKDGWRAESHISFMGRRREGIYAEAEPAVYSSFGVSKKVLKDSGTIALNVEDPFFMYRYGWSVNTGDVQASGKSKFHTIHYGLSFIYNFGRETNGKQRENVTDEMRRM